MHSRFTEQLKGSAMQDLAGVVLEFATPAAFVRLNVADGVTTVVLAVAL